MDFYWVPVHNNCRIFKCQSLELLIWVERKMRRRKKINTKLIMYYVPDIVLHTFQRLIHVILTSVLWDRNYYQPYFMYEETKTQVKELAQIQSKQWSELRYILRNLAPEPMPRLLWMGERKCINAVQSFATLCKNKGKNSKWGGNSIRLQIFMQQWNVLSS